MSLKDSQRIFEALASTVRRSILVYLSQGELTAGEIMSRFEMSKPSVSQHLSVLASAGLVESERRGQFVYYRLVSENLVNTVHTFLAEACPVGRPLKREAKALAVKKAGMKKD